MCVIKVLYHMNPSTALANSLNMEFHYYLGQMAEGQMLALFHMNLFLCQIQNPVTDVANTHSIYTHHSSNLYQFAP